MSYDSIAKFVIARVDASQKILGAPLGALVHHEFPDFNLRKEFGGLRPFVQQHCAAAIEVQRGAHKGQDDIYVSKAAPPLPGVGTLPLTRAATDTAWRVFTIPGLFAKLYANPESGAIQVDSAEGMSAPWIEVPNVTLEEHLHIAKDFLDTTIDEADREKFASFLNEGNVATEWARQMRFFESGKYQRSWVAYRYERLLALFTDRLKTLAFPEDRAALALENLRRTKPSKIRPFKALTVSSPPSFDRSDLRSVISNALADLSEDDLRRVWLPIGPVADALRRSRS
jgi:hypothetical protein